MKPESVQSVPAGKRPKIKRPAKYKNLISRMQPRLRVKKLGWWYFVVAASISVVVLFGVYDYMSNYVYVVLLNDREVGIVDDVEEIEAFIAELADLCGDLYGMETEPGDEITMIKEFRPGSKPQPGTVRTAIRNELSFRAEAFMIKVDGIPLVPVRSEEALVMAINSLKQSYFSDDSRVKVVDVFIMEDLELEACLVNPEEVFSPEEVAALLMEDNEDQTLQTALLPASSDRGMFDSRKSNNDIAPEYLFGADLEIQTEEKPQLNISGVNVKTLEEATVVEEIPFSTETVYDEEMWIVQNEIKVPGQPGKKEIVYYITRENGVEIDRIKISEKITEEPVTQVEAIGTARVPSVGSGQFVWPVQGGGEVTPGRGFSSYHTGIDIHAATGTNILAADSGVVWFSGRGGSQGNYMILYHGSYWTLYLHNSVNLASKGTRVEQGEVIAKVGSTGRSTGPHLHFEVRLDDGSGEWHTYYQHTPVDPLRFFRP